MISRITSQTQEHGLRVGGDSSFSFSVNLTPLWYDEPSKAEEP